MRQLSYRITNLSPIIFSAKHGDANMVGTLQYIPGTSVLGMLAARFLNQKKIHSKTACFNDEFYDCFLKGEVRFGNACIFLKDNDGVEYVHFPAPVSIHEEKRGNRIYDLLRADDEPEEQTKAKQGFCHLDGEDVRFTEVETGLNFHHARDRKTGISKERQIFNYESIEKGQVFQGVIKGSSEALNTLFSTCGIQWTGYIGRSKNAQYGKVCFEFIDRTPQPVSDTINPDKKLSVTLISDTILYNDNGFSTTDTAVLAKYLGVKISKSFIRQEDTETFVGVWRLKKPSETCFKAGSCFLLDDVSEADVLKLSEFQKTGIGERTHEGFGQCIIGRQTEKNLTEKPLKLPETRKPDTQIPHMTKEILKTLIQNAARKETVLNAMRDMNGFKKLPSPSLIGRLNAMAGKLEREKFVEGLGKFRDIALKKLKACRNNQQNLMDFLKEKKISAKDVFQNTQLPDLRELCGEIGYTPEDDKDFESELYRTYLTQFFSTMRKKTIKTKEGQHDRE